MSLTFTTRIATTGSDSWRNGSRICLDKPKTLEAAVAVLLEKCEAKCGGYVSVKLDSPHRPRTYGPKKTKPSDPGYQSNHLHGHLSQLAIHFGYTKQEMKEIMKDDVPEWPMEKRRIGQRVKMRPVSEADVSIEVESKAIEWAHLIAAEEGIMLEEGNENEAS